MPGRHYLLMPIKRGTAREDGRVFSHYDAKCKNPERWVTPEQLAHSREMSRLRAKRNKTPENDKAKRIKYRTQRLEYSKKWRAENHSLCREYDKRTKLKRADDPIFKLKNNYRSRLSHAIRAKNFNKTSSTASALGCTWEELQCHLEAQFDDEMSWENYGKWHVDHVYPLAKARTTEELMLLLHYTNLQPLWAIDNLSKGVTESELSASRLRVQ